MFLPEFDKNYLTQKEYLFDELVDSNRNGLIIKDWILPWGKFNLTKSDLLIIIPPGYPEVKPDMWYFNPDILIAPNNKPPRQTQVKITFAGRSWQRWSRHFPANEWRSGIDAIHTYLKRIQLALETAS
jgi:hypothetical protein